MSEHLIGQIATVGISHASYPRRRLRTETWLHRFYENISSLNIYLCFAKIFVWNLSWPYRWFVWCVRNKPHLVSEELLPCSFERLWIHSFERTFHRRYCRDWIRIFARWDLQDLETACTVLSGHKTFARRHFKVSWSERMNIPTLEWRSFALSIFGYELSSFECQKRLRNLTIWNRIPIWQNFFLATLPSLPLRLLTI